MTNNAVKFEENYIFRNNKSITSNNDIALTEFVANAWDAGAHNVDITIPFEEHEKIVVEDDGTGMTDEEFRSRWMTLNSCASCLKTMRKMIYWNQRKGW